jgi:anti-anti-sigma factor
MNCTVTYQGEREVLVIAGELNIEHAQALKETLLQSLAGTGPLLLNLENVTAIDLSCLQLLCAAHRSWLAANRELAIASCSGVFSQTARDAGYSREMGCSIDANRSCLWLCHEPSIHREPADGHNPVQEVTG